MELELENLITVTGSADLIREFYEIDTLTLSPSSTDRQILIVESRYAEPINSTEVKVKFYATDTGITQLNNYGLITQIILTKAEIEEHLDEVSLEIGRDTPPIA